MRKQQIIILGVVFGISLLGLIALQARYFHTVDEVKKEQFWFSVNRAMDEIADYIREQEKAGSKLEQQSTLDNRKNNTIVPMYVDPKRIIASKNDPSLMLGSTLCLIDDEGDIQDVSEFVGKKSQENNINASIARLQQELKEKTGKEFRLVIGDERFHSVEGFVNLDHLYGVIGNALKDHAIHSRFEFGIKERGKFILSSKDFLSEASDIGFNRKIYPGESEDTAVLYLKFPDASSDLSGSFWMLLPSLLIIIALVVCSVFCLIVIVRQKKLSAIKNDFINNMTHEFKTPIATISLASQMLKDGAVANTPDSVDRIATIIRDESKRLTFQVERVLQTALFTETRMKLKLKNLNINQLIEDLLPKFSLRVEDKGGQVFGHLDAEQDEVLADEVHITNVVSNLVDNAIKYCTKAPEISIYTRNRDKDIIISVIDNGIGIAKKDQKLVFERFYRISTGNLHDVKGFGLGLSYVKKIVEAHGGRVEVESSLGKGSCFDIILPLTSKKQKIKRTLFF